MKDRLGARSAGRAASPGIAAEAGTGGGAAGGPPDLRGTRASLLARADFTGPALRAALSEAADRWLATLLGGEGDVALLAVGGYGRRDPAPGSDLDLVLLHRGRPDIRELADRLWYPIWDAGIGLDHSVRTVRDAVEVAGRDLKAALGLLDARHVAGDKKLSDELGFAVRAAWRAAAPRRLPVMHAAVMDRAARHGEVAFLLEPDLKESRGGIRDVHALHAVAVAQVADEPRPAVRAAHDRLLDVRAELHRRTGRGGDRLLLQEQDAVAVALGYADADQLMVAVADAGRTIAYASDVTWRRVEAWAGASKRRWSARRRSSVRRPLAADVVEQDGEVVLARDADPAGDPVLVLRAAAAAASAGLPIAPHALDRLVAESGPLPEPWPVAAREELVALLGTGPAALPVFEALDQAGLVVRLLPEWASVRSKPQRNAYHRFTVDRHLCETAAEAAARSRRVARPDLLLLGAFLHDIGKGVPGDHIDNGVALVEGIGPRLGLPPADVRTLVDLVRHHLLLADTATRRDLDDPATVSTVAAAVRDRDTLDLLHMLTEADALATGPAAWSEWKAALVDDLARRTAAVLVGAPAPVADLLTPTQRALADAEELGVQVAPGVGGSVTVTVAALNRVGLLAEAAGVLALHRLDVKAASVTAVGSMAVCAFTVTARFGVPPDRTLVRDDIRRALAGQLPVAQRLAERERSYPRRPHAATSAPPRVLFLDGASETATVVEVRAHDTAGLLHRVAAALGGCGLDVRSARVSTFGAEAVDAFYVSGPDGGRLTDTGRRRQVEQAVLAALPG